MYIICSKEREKDTIFCFQEVGYKYHETRIVSGLSGDFTPYEKKIEGYYEIQFKNINSNYSFKCSEENYKRFYSDFLYAIHKGDKTFTLHSHKYEYFCSF